MYSSLHHWSCRLIVFILFVECISLRDLTFCLNSKKIATVKHILMQADFVTLTSGKRYVMTAERVKGVVWVFVRTSHSPPPNSNS